MSSTAVAQQHPATSGFHQRSGQGRRVRGAARCNHGGAVAAGSARIHHPSRRLGWRRGSTGRPWPASTASRVAPRPLRSLSGRGRRLGSAAAQPRLRLETRARAHTHTHTHTLVHRLTYTYTDTDTHTHRGSRTPTRTSHEHSHGGTRRGTQSRRHAPPFYRGRTTRGATWPTPSGESESRFRRRLRLGSARPSGRASRRRLRERSPGPRSCTEPGPAHCGEQQRLGQRGGGGRGVAAGAGRAAGRSLAPV